MGELVLPKVARLVNPATMEVFDIDLAAPIEQKVVWLDHVSELQGQLRHAKKLLDESILVEMDRNAAWTLEIDRVKLVGQSPEKKREWDIEALRETLDVLVDEGKISREARDQVVKEEVSYKVVQRGVNQLEKVPGVAEKLAECYVLVDPVRRISRRPA